MGRGAAESVRAARPVVDRFEGFDSGRHEQRQPVEGQGDHDVDDLADPGAQHDRQDDEQGQ